MPPMQMQSVFEFHLTSHYPPMLRGLRLAAYRQIFTRRLIQCAISNPAAIRRFPTNASEFAYLINNDQQIIEIT